MHKKFKAIRWGQNILYALKDTACFAVIVAVCLMMLNASFMQAQGQNQDEFKGQVNESSFTGSATDNTFSLSVSKSKLLGFEFAPLGKNKMLPATITKVQVNSPAYIAGLRTGDKWLYGNLQSDAPQLILEHAGNPYQARFGKTQLAGYVPNTNLKVPNNTSLGNLPKPAIPTHIMPGNISSSLPPLNREQAFLATRQVVILIDKSGSMATEDCPGGKTRWQWCAEQTSLLTKKADDSFKKGIVVGVFSSEGTLYHDVTAQKVKEIFSVNQPKGGTHPEQLLQEVLDDYFNFGRKKGPLSIAIVTDGEPNDPDAVASVIIDATQRMIDSGEVSITFLQVGAGAEGIQIMRRYANNLEVEGARYDIVDYKNFDDLQKVGLLGSLVNATTEPIAKSKQNENAGLVRTNTPAYVNTQLGTTRQLQQAEQRRNDIEQKLLSK